MTASPEPARPTESAERAITAIPGRDALPSGASTSGRTGGGLADGDGALEALLRLETWLESMRVPPSGDVPAGYGGPVVHWWRDSRVYIGAGFDWRYEGILHGYVALATRTGERRWLDKARRAGDDLVAAQLPNGNFRRSGFEQNPSTAGTPHEAAACSGLLALAAMCRARGEQGWERYLETAQRNVTQFQVGRLWDGDARLFRDDPARPTFVPNKAATLVETLVALADLTGDGVWLERYARPTLDAILRHQVRQPGDALDGAIAQNSFGSTVVAKYFPYYVARCVPALVMGYERFGEQRLLDGALAAGAFLLRVRDGDGGLPQVLYPGRRMNREPRWIAATGDVLRALALLNAHGLGADMAPGRAWLLRGQLPSGAFRVSDAHGDAAVAGWNDKAFRYLAGSVPGAPS